MANSCTVTKQHIECAKKLRRFPCWMAKNSSPMYFIWRECNFEMRDCQSLLEYKAVNVKRQCRIFVEPWSDSIHIVLWRNDGFLHSFHDFSKSNAFRKNLIRMEFILHKIFFRMNILSISKTLWMFFNLH